MFSRYICRILLFLTFAIPVTASPVVSTASYNESKYMNHSTDERYYVGKPFTTKYTYENQKNYSQTKADSNKTYRIGHSSHRHIGRRQHRGRGHSLCHHSACHGRLLLLYRPDRRRLR